MRRKIYNTPDLEIIMLELNDVCGDVIHSSFEHGGTNAGWNFDNDEDENWGGESVW